jgi:modulator of FtsH protease HflK
MTMTELGGRISHIGWATAGKRSPWGTPGDDGGDGGVEGGIEGGGAEGSGPAADQGADAGKSSPGKAGAGATAPPAKPRADRPNGDGAKGDGPKGDGPRNPWLPPADAEPPRRSASIEDIFRARSGKGGGSGGGGGMPRLPRLPDGRSWLPLAIGAVLLLWLGSSMVHRIAPQEKGVVTTLGKFSGVLSPGTSLTLPWPIQNVSIRDVTSIRRDSMPDTDSERLMLTADQNLIDLSYLVR